MPHLLKTLEPGHLIVLLALLAAYAGEARAQVLPFGFVDEGVHAGGFATALAQLPDGRFLVAEKNAARVVIVTASASAPVLTLSGVTTAGARGLLGMAVDPAWPSRPYVYLAWTDGIAGDGRVARFTAQGALQDATSTAMTLADQHLVLTGIPDASPLHNVAGLVFDANGLLYVGSGDDADPCASQDPGGLLGRVLRLDPRGLPAGAGGPPPMSALVPAGNPFSGPNDAARLTWCLGLRHPFSFEVEALRGELLVADVGDLTIEELNVSRAGGENFGWPWFEGSGTATGNCTTSAPTNAIAPEAEWDRRQLPPGPASAMSVVVYRAPPGAPHAFGAAYEGSWFVTDYFHGFLRRLEDAGGTWSLGAPVAGQPAPENWAEGLPGISDALVGLDGAIYYLRGTELRRIRPAAQLGALTRVAGDAQVATPGLPLRRALEVRATDASGVPVAGVAVTFDDVTGSGQLGPQPVLTDALGIARTSYLTGVAGVATVRVEATAPGYASTGFDVRWRGLNVGLSPIVLGPPWVGAFDLEIVHSATASPFTFVVQAGMPVGIPTAYGEIRTDILGLMARPDMLVFDGLGLLFAPDPAFVTGANTPTWTGLLPVPAGLSGVSFTMQAYAVDAGLLPLQEGVLVTNAVVVTIP